MTVRARTTEGGNLFHWSRVRGELHLRAELPKAVDHSYRALYWARSSLKRLHRKRDGAGMCHDEWHQRLHWTDFVQPVFHVSEGTHQVLVTGVVTTSEIFKCKRFLREEEAKPPFDFYKEYGPLLDAMRARDGRKPLKR